MRISFAAIVCVFTLLSCVHKGDLSRTNEQRVPAQYKKDFLPSANDLSLEELKTILQQQQFSKIEDLLAHVSQIKPKYMGAYTLGYNSKSLHESSLEYPRAIVYGETGNFIISFNGHKDQKAFEMLEVAKFNQETKKFEFYEIEFNEKKQLNQPFKISANGGPEGKCLQCHTNGRPIWNHYDIWPGFYGASDDLPMTQFNKRGTSSVFGMQSRKAQAEWTHWTSSRPTKARYRHLAESGKQPNSDLNIILGNHNFKRISQLVKEARPHRARLPILYGLFCTPSIEDSPQLSAIHKEFKASANRDLQEHRAVTIFEHWRELGLDWKQIRDEMLEQALEREQRSEKKMNQEQIALELRSDNEWEQAQKLARSELSDYSIKAQATPLLSLVKHYLPQAKVETWPMQLHEGIYRFDTGDFFDHLLEKALIDVAFGNPVTPADRPLIDKMIAARQAYRANHENHTIYAKKVHELTQPCAELAELFLKE